MLLACVDYDIKGDPDEPDGLDTSVDTDCPPSIPDCMDTDTTPVDTDTATVIDPDDCTVTAVAAGTVTINDECTGTTSGGEITDPYDLNIEYQYTSSASGSVVKTSVINLTDDDGDGAVTTDDIPEIVFTVYSANELVVLSGDYSGEILVQSGWNGSGDIVTADVDGDGEVEICGFNTSNQIQCIHIDGTNVWTSTGRASSGYPHITACDLDQDGTPEVIGDNVVVDGTDGSTLFTFAASSAYSVPVCADIDRDGTSEIIHGDSVYDHNGNVEWSMPASGTSEMAGVINADSDDEAEVFLASDTLSIYEHDGTLKASVGIANRYPGPPCAADFDGDGEVEIAVPQGTLFILYETDGTEIWRSTMQDGSGLAGCSGYDMDGDSIYEVLFADEVAVRLYDGRTGAVLYESYAHNSGTLYEYPVVADVDHDGSSEIIISENLGTQMGITVYGHAGSGWPASGPAWQSHDFAVTNFEADGSIPQHPEESWLKYNVFRARPAVDDPSSPDLGGDIVDVCVADCVNGPVKVSVQVWNEGALDVDAGVPWSYYRDDGGSLTYVMSGVLPALPMGVSAASFEIELTPDQLGDNGFVIRLDDDGMGGEELGECFEDNNTLTYTDTLCP